MISSTDARNKRVPKATRTTKKSAAKAEAAAEVLDAAATDAEYQLKVEEAAAST